MAMYESYNIIVAIAQVYCAGCRLFYLATHFSLTFYFEQMEMN